MTAIPEDLDYLAARIHGRRSRLAEAQRLEALCRLRSLEALSRAVFPEAEPAGVLELQRRVALGWLEELEELARGLGPRRARMIEAYANRIGVEDLKVLIRGLSGGAPPASLQSRLLRPLTAAAAASLASAEELVTRPPAPEGDGAAARLPRPFVLETTLDRRYFQGLVAAMDGLDRLDRSGIRALVHQEVDHFHLMLVVRGRFLHGLEAEALLPWHVEGAGMARELLSEMLSAPDLARAAAMAVGLALDAVPPPERLEPAALDALAWRRFLRLARRTFREGAMGFAALVGYAALRRVEVANLITVSEGIRMGLAGDAIGAHLVPRAGLEAARA